MTTPKNAILQGRSGGKIIGGMAAFATLGVLVLAPASGWLVRTQLGMVVGGPIFGRADDYLHPDSSNDVRRAAQAARVAAQHPDDLEIQMAARQQEMPTPTADAYEGWGLRSANALRPLCAQFGDRPALHAAILRDLSHEAVSLSPRMEVNLLTEAKPHPVYAKPDKNANLPENAALWEQSARAGEKLDPDNAFFPLMHAVGFFASHRDEEAIAALHAAAKLPRYNEYLGEETRGQWRLMEADGEPGHMARLEAHAGVRNPDYAEMGQAARLATVCAMRDEIAGDVESGYRTRMALTRIGALIQAQSSTLYGGLMARRMGMAAWLRPGGVHPLPKNPDSESRDEAKRNAAYAQRDKENLKRYCQYLQTIGHENAVEEVREAAQAGQAFRQRFETANGRPDNVLEAQPAFRLTLWWGAGTGLLTNLFLLLLLGGVCARLARTARIRNGLPLSPAVRAGMVSAFVLPAWGFGVMRFWPEPASLVLLGAGVVALLMVLRKAARSAPTGGNSGKTWASAINSPNVSSYFNALWATLIAGGVFMGLALDSGLRTVHTADVYMGFASSEVGWNTWMVLGVALSSGVSLLLLLGLVIYSCMVRVPLSVGVVRGFRKLALPVAAGIVVLYAGVVCQTLHEEARANAALQQCVDQGESRYVSSLKGSVK